MNIAADARVALEVSNLSFTYRGETNATLTSVSLRVMSGRSVGILGANGAGKSTLLGAITGTRDGHRTGAIFLDGCAQYDRRAVGFAPQDIALYQLLTVRENLEHVARLTVPRRSIKGAVEQTLDEFALQDLSSRPVHELSGGQQRLAHLAVSFVHRPPVRFLDEPTTGLDFHTRQRLVELVQSWRGEGVAVVVTAHYPEDIEELCSDIVLLRDGTVHALGNLRAFLMAREPTLHLLLEEPASGEASEHVLGLPDLTPVSLAAALGHIPHGHGTITSIQLAGTSLRGVLMADPTLADVMVDGDPA